MDIYKINFKKWLDEEDFDPDIKKELQSLKEELRASETNGAAGAESREKAEAEIKERFEKELRFGTGGLRGLLGAGTNRINIYTVRRTTQGICDYIMEDI